MLKRILMTLLIMGCFAPLFAQKNKMDTPDQKAWKQIDSLMGRGLPKSAAEIARKILTGAQNRKDNPAVIKARLFLIAADTYTGEEADTARIKRAETYAAAASGAEKAIWQSITAQLYWGYFQQNRWKLYQRTALAGTPSDDIETWDAPAFFNKIAALYKASLADRMTLQNIPLEQYSPMLTTGTNTRNLRPTLYDLLVFRALSFFQNDEKDVVNPAYKFELDNAGVFSAQSVFSALPLLHRDSTSLHLQALKLYQEVLAFHTKDAKPDALIDADLQRLTFVYAHSVNPDKDSLYLNALRQLEQRYDGNPAVAQVAYLVAMQEMGNAGVQPVSRGKVQGTPAKKSDRNLPAILAKLQKIVSRYPGTEGAVNAFNQLQNMQQPVLQLQAEEVNLPGENVKALVTYQNMDKAYLRLYRIQNDVKTNEYYDQTPLFERLQRLSPLKTWEQALPGAADMEQHNAEIKIDALTKGAYILVISKKEKWTKDDQNNIIASVRFQVSAISLVNNSASSKAYILNRKTGAAQAGVKASFWAQKWNSKKSRYEALSLSSGVSDAAGSVSMPLDRESNYDNRLAAVTLVSGDDTLQVGGYFNVSDYDRIAPGTTAHTVFFTDRSIYRPGQTIYFKGISLNSADYGRRNEILAGRKTTINFYDANNQKLRSLEVTSNEFGSFTGNFTAPDGLLGGVMHIEDEGTHDQAYFSVEEYKRPKFYVAFDTLKGNYNLDQQVQVKAFAKAYAGNNIDGATVKYRVVRRARFPYYWCFYRWGMPSSPEMEIANGTATTGADGSFDIAFRTIPDKSVDPKALPVFSYTVYADVTDLNGETRNANTSVQSGYRSLQINAAITEDSRPEDLDMVIVRTENLNGIFTPATVKVTVSRLQYPGFFRKRLWETPDQFTMTEEEFRKAFPDDEYKEESNYLNWEKGKTLWEQTLTTTAEGIVKIPAGTWDQNGWYLVELDSKDAQGNEVTEKKYTHVWTPGRKGDVEKDLVTYTDKELYQPGDEAALWTATAAKEPHLLLVTDKISGPANTDNIKNPLTFKLTEADRGGMAFSWLYVYRNRVYTASKTINVPWTNKDLNLEWATHRDKLLPGAAEEWTLTIKGNKKEKVAAELLAGMYDASLDAFKPHSWTQGILFPTIYNSTQWNGNYASGVAGPVMLQYYNQDNYQSYDKSYDEIDGLPGGTLITPGYVALWGREEKAAGRMMSRAAPAPAARNAMYAGEADAAPMLEQMSVTDLTRKIEGGDPGIQVTHGGGKPETTEKDVPQIRKNLQETAFFFPQLATDAEGNVKVKFTIPEALTEWKMMAFAHTKDWKTGYLEGKVKTQKDLMVMPNLPRFLRQNDEMVISTKISNLSDKVLNGTATLEILDAATLQPAQLSFRLQDNKQNFEVAKGLSTTASWTIHVPESRYTPVVFRIVAKAGNFSDGEENTLPVITNRTLVTETLPLPVRGNEEKSFTLEKLLHQNSSTLTNHALTVEFTGNPAWYAVQALPYLMEYPYECAEQTFNRFYANALAGHIVAQSPKVEQIFAKWKTQDTAALLSNLEKNEELKSALLEETPWVLEAKDESEQKRRIASLFETHKLAKDLGRNLKKLEQMQLSEGGFPWFKGMQSDRFITQYIITGIARLQHLNVESAGKNEAADILGKALPYLDRQLKDDYDNLVKYKAKLDDQQISYMQIQYLYMRSFYSAKAIPAASQKAFDYYKKQAAKYWPNFNPYMKGQIALALQRWNDVKVPAQIMASLKETAINKEEMGMYWKDMPQGYWWYEAPIEAQSLLIEAFAEVAKDNKAVDAMKVWLLKQKQTQNWKTTKATADACYALLLQGSDWLTNEPVVTINLGNEQIRSTEIKTEAGTGYFKKRYSGQAVKPEMGAIKVKVDQVKNEGVSWGAVYWQYFEDLDKITAAATPLSLKKQLFIERNTDRGPVLTEIKAGNELQVGDKVKVRIELRVDRDMEYVHMKDMRAACMEPVNVLSAYKYQGGLGYYESTKDVATNFFFNYLRKGTYVFEYPVFVTAKGDFSNGISTIQCMYAPEFSSHSEGIRVKVK
jgi:uncharacterized protein YfaS (alpha-2-macroglobulin family)